MENKSKKLFNIMLFILKFVLLIWIWENKGLIYGLAGWLAVDLAIILLYFAIDKHKRELVLTSFMGGVRTIELQLFGHTNEIELKRGDKNKPDRSVKEKVKGGRDRARGL